MGNLCLEREESRAVRELTARLREDPHLLDDIDGFAADMWRNPNFTVSLIFGILCSYACLMGGFAGGPIFDVTALTLSLLPIMITAGLGTWYAQVYAEKHARGLLAEAVVRRADVRPRWTPTVEAQRLLAQATAPPLHIFTSTPSAPVSSTPPGSLSEVLLQDEGADADCCICFAPLKDLPSQRLGGCTHVLHTECWDQWRVRNPTCPLCRATG